MLATTLPMEQLLVLHQQGLNITAIALAIGYPPNRGQNQIANALIRAGVYHRDPYRPRPKHKATRTPKPRTLSHRIGRPALQVAGQRFLNLVAIRRVPGPYKASTWWLCVCDCGREQKRYVRQLRDPRLKCGYFPCECRPNPGGAAVGYRVETLRQHRLREREDVRQQKMAAKRCIDCGCKIPDIKALCRKRCLDCRKATYSRGRKYKNNAWEPVNKRLVFARDNWTCQHCHRPTPQELMSHLTAPNAPHADHILPERHGGATSYANTQCLCAACNYKKGSAIEQEPRLVGVTDFTPYKVAQYPCWPSRGEMQRAGKRAARALPRLTYAGV